MRHSIFEGSATAVVTPMNGYGNLDFDAFGRLLEWMIREGTDAVVVNGTTGESATLDDKEKMAVIRYAVRQVDGKMCIRDRSLPEQACAMLEQKLSSVRDIRRENELFL